MQYRRPSDRFYMVQGFRPNGMSTGPAYVVHNSGAEALQEAKRLAAKSPGNTYVVMQAVVEAQAPPHVEVRAIS